MRTCTPGSVFAYCDRARLLFGNQNICGVSFGHDFHTVCGDDPLVEVAFR